MPSPAARQRRNDSVVVRPTPHHPKVHLANATCPRAPRSRRTREGPRPNRLGPPSLTPREARLWPLRLPRKSFKPTHALEAEYGLTEPPLVVALPFILRGPTT